MSGLESNEVNMNGHNNIQTEMQSPVGQITNAFILNEQHNTARNNTGVRRTSEPISGTELNITFRGPTIRTSSGDTMDTSASSSPQVSSNGIQHSARRSSDITDNVSSSYQARGITEAPKVDNTVVSSEIKDSFEVTSAVKEPNMSQHVDNVPVNHVKSNANGSTEQDDLKNVPGNNVSIATNDLNQSSSSNDQTDNANVNKLSGNYSSNVQSDWTSGLNNKNGVNKPSSTDYSSNGLSKANDNMAPVPPARVSRSSVGEIRAAALRRSQPSLSSMEEENLRERRRTSLLRDCRCMLDKAVNNGLTKDAFRRCFQTKVQFFQLVLIICLIVF